MEGNMFCHFFSDLSRIGAIVVFVILFFTFNEFYLTPWQCLVLKTCRIYNTFGGEVNQSINTQTMAQANTFISGKLIDLLQGSGARFVTWFYTMYGLSCLKKSLKATVHGAAFDSDTKNTWIVPAVEDIEDKVIWSATFCLFRASFPAIKALQFCDSIISL